ncbi:hypothetical protein ES703_09039 [subsurface metagenome]
MVKTAVRLLRTSRAGRRARNDTISSPVIARSEATWQSHIDRKANVRLLRTSRARRRARNDTLEKRVG